MDAIWNESDERHTEELIAIREAIISETSTFIMEINNFIKVFYIKCGNYNIIMYTPAV